MTSQLVFMGAVTLLTLAVALPSVMSKSVADWNFLDDFETRHEPTPHHKHQKNAPPTFANWELLNDFETRHEPTPHHKHQKNAPPTFANWELHNDFETREPTPTKNAPPATVEESKGDVESDQHECDCQIHPAIPPHCFHCTGDECKNCPFPTVSFNPEFYHHLESMPWKFTAISFTFPQELTSDSQVSGKDEHQTEEVAEHTGEKPASVRSLFKRSPNRY